MDNKENLTPEQEAEELKAAQAPQEEEVRENIISEYGFDETDDSDKIDKLVGKEMDNAKKLSSAIGQKIKQREKVAELEKQINETPKPKEGDVKIDVENLDEKVDKRVTETLEQKSIDDLGYSDELSKEIKDLAKLKGKSVKEILRDPYIVSRVEAFEDEQEVDEASISKNNKRRGKKVLSLDNPPEVDMNTEEGRKEWDDWKQAQIKAGH